MDRARGFVVRNCHVGISPCCHSMSQSLFDECVVAAARDQDRAMSTTAQQSVRGCGVERCACVAPRGQDATTAARCSSHVVTV